MNSKECKKIISYYYEHGVVIVTTNLTHKDLTEIFNNDKIHTLAITNQVHT
jgi:DNA replication protein DnaC